MAGRPLSGSGVASRALGLILVLQLWPAEVLGQGESGLVAPYVSTVTQDVEAMLDLAGVGPGDYLIDLGSGDGRIVLAAARRGAMAHGVELREDLVAEARRRARRQGLEDRVSFVQGDIFDAPISAATVVTLYLMPEVNIQLRPRLLAELQPGTRVVSNSFHMGDWTPDDRVSGRSSGGLLYWVIPAQVAGRWSVTGPDGDWRLDIDQSHQMINAELRDGGRRIHVDEARLDGDRISLVARQGNHRYALSGQVDGADMAGFLQIDDGDRQRVTAWSARRSEAAD